MSSKPSNRSTGLGREGFDVGMRLTKRRIQGKMVRRSASVETIARTKQRSQAIFPRVCRPALRTQGSVCPLTALRKESRARPSEGERFTGFRSKLE